MWRSSAFRAFARWGLCQRHKPKPQPPAQESDRVDRSIALVTGFGTEDRERRSGGQKETFDKRQYFADRPEVSLLETVGWVGTVLTVGLNLRLHSKRDDVDRSRDGRDACSSSSFTVCSLLHRFLLQFALASPLFPRFDAFKSVLPREPSSSSPNSDPAASSSSVETSAPVSSSHELEDLARACIGQMENFKGAQLISSDARKAVKHFERARTLGTSSAHYNLGICYEKGIGVAEDLDKAAHHYEQAAMKGHARATYNLGVFYLEGLGGLNADPNRGLELIKKASLLGVPQAKTYMGQQYLQQCIWEEAVTLFRDAAQENDPDASYFLGVCYANGLGVQKDPKTAALHYKRAASAGDEEAAVALRDLDLKPAKGTGSTSITPDIVVSSDIQPSPAKTGPSSRGERSRLHHSSSSPELSQWGTPQNVAERRAEASRYQEVFLRQKPPLDISLGEDEDAFLTMTNNDLSRVARQEVCVT